MNYHETCPHCGAKVTAYLVRLNEPLLGAFLLFAEARIRAGAPVRKSDLPLDHSQYGNFQKLRHFGLVRAVEGGVWEMTPAGWDFLRGRGRVLNPAAQFGNGALPEDHPAWMTHRGERVLVSIRDVLPTAWQQRADYAAEKAEGA